MSCGVGEVHLPTIRGAWGDSVGLGGQSLTEDAVAARETR